MLRKESLGVIQLIVIFTNIEAINTISKAVSLEPPPTTGLLFCFVFEKKTFEVDVSINVNTLMEKNGNTKIKTNDMSEDSHNNATNKPVYLNNKFTLDAAVFLGLLPPPLPPPPPLLLSLMPIYHNQGKNRTPNHFIQ